jgi:regulator of sigma D
MIYIWYNETGWGNVKIKNKEKILMEIKEKFKLNDKLIERIFEAYLCSISGKSNILIDELLKRYQQIVDFLDNFLIIYFELRN